MSARDGDVTVTFTGDLASLQRAHERLFRDMDRLIGSYGKVVAAMRGVEGQAQKSQAATSQMARSGMTEVASFAAQIAGLAANLGGLAKVAQVIRAEYEDFKRKTTTAADQQQGAFAAIERARMNLGVDPTLSPEQMVAAIRESSRKHHLAGGLPETAQVFERVLGAKGEVPGKLAVDTASEVIKTFQFLPGGELADIAEASERISSSMGMSPKEALGFLIKGQQASKITDISKFSANTVATMLAGMNATGGKDRPEFLMREAVQMQTLMEDRQGRMGATAELGLMLQVREAVKGKPGIETYEQARAYLRDTPEGQKITQQLLETVLPNEAALQKAMVKMGQGTVADALHGEVRALPAMRAKLTNGVLPSGQTVAEQAAELDKIIVGRGAPALQAHAEYSAQLANEPLAQAARAGRAVAGVAESAELDNVWGATLGVLRTQYERLMTQHPTPALVRKFEMMSMDVQLAKGDNPQQILRNFRQVMAEVAPIAEANKLPQAQHYRQVLENLEALQSPEDIAAEAEGDKVERQRSNQAAERDFRGAHRWLNGRWQTKNPIDRLMGALGSSDPDARRPVPGGTLPFPADGMPPSGEAEEGSTLVGFLRGGLRTLNMTGPPDQFGPASAPGAQGAAPAADPKMEEQTEELRKINGNLQRQLESMGKLALYRPQGSSGFEVEIG